MRVEASQETLRLLRQGRAVPLHGLGSRTASALSPSLFLRFVARTAPPLARSPSPAGRPKGLSRSHPRPQIQLHLPQLRCVDLAISSIPFVLGQLRGSTSEEDAVPAHAYD